MGALESILTFLGSTLCHQLEERSFYIDGFQMPLCARCLGIHLAFLISAAIILARRDPRLSGLPSVRSMAAISLLLLPATADVVLSYSGIMDTDNTRRVVTGALFGTAIAFIVIPFASSMLAKLNAVGTSLAHPFHWVMVAAAASAASVLALSAESSKELFYAVAIAGVAGMLATVSCLMLLLVLLLTEDTQWRNASKVQASAAAAVLFLVVLGLLHDAALD
jgi:uncharacterized membrane protein